MVIFYQANSNYRFDTAENHGECALCKGAKATELVPCCWCTNWVHLRCSYAVPSGRACASHFDAQNPLEKQVVACKDDSLVPVEFRERPVFPNIVIPRYQPNRQAGPKAARTIWNLCGSIDTHGVELDSTIERVTTLSLRNLKGINPPLCLKQ